MKRTRFHYGEPRWRALRAEILAARPVCEVPGCTEPPHHVDHRVAIAKGGDPYNPRNLIALCTQCHSRKTARFDGGFGNRRRPGGDEYLRLPGCDADGNPRSPLHRWANKRSA